MDRPLKESSGATATRYNRIAGIYDLSEYLVERLLYRRWRRRLWSLVTPGRGLEVGVGTGKNIPDHPSDSRITSIDMSPKMLKQARRQADRLGTPVELVEMDAEHLDFQDDTFDWAVASFVFCSVPNAVEGLRELDRVVKPGGPILLLEHVRIDRPLIGRLMDICNPPAVRVTGANINRRTVENAARSGLKIEAVEDLTPLGAFKLITARS
ncbi:MAG: class I SAM-dependent methyltransferase [Chloroflexi bacterium]|nr:class I SAM-dependent methyltransferase [Chloroflexota bacterium]